MRKFGLGLPQAVAIQRGVISPPLIRTRGKIKEAIIGTEELVLPFQSPHCNQVMQIGGLLGTRKKTSTEKSGKAWAYVPVRVSPCT